MSRSALAAFPSNMTFTRRRDAKVLAALALVAGIAGACSASPEAAPAAATTSSSPPTSEAPASATPKASTSDDEEAELDVDQMSAKDFRKVQRYRVDTSYAAAIEKYGEDAVYIAALRNESKLLLEADPDLFKPASQYVVIGISTCEALDSGGSLEEGWREISEEIEYDEQEDPMHLMADFFQSALVNAVPVYCPEHQDEADAYEQSRR